MVFNESKAKVGLDRAEKFRNEGGWPVALALARKYASQDATLEVVYNGGTADYLIASGGARIAYVASTSLRRVVNERTRQVLSHDVNGPIDRWFGLSYVNDILRENPRTIHARPDENNINWQLAYQQDRLSSVLSFGTAEERSDLIEKTLQSIRPDFAAENPKFGGEQDVAEASEAGVTLTRVARALVQSDKKTAMELMDRGVNLVRLANQKLPNPNRLRTIMEWYYDFLTKTGQSEKLREKAREFSSAGVSADEVKRRQVRERQMGTAYRLAFTAIPIEMITRPYRVPTLTRR